MGSSQEEIDLYGLPIEMEVLVKLMEEMAGQPKEAYGKREPGERQASEIYGDRFR